jgi:predicted porin
MEGEDRVSNIAMYTTPIYSGFSATLAVIPGEDSANGKDGIADGNSLSVKYKMDGLTASISKNSDIDGQDTVRFVTEASIDNLKLGALWQTAEKVDSTNEEDSWLISGEYKLGNGYSVKAQYGMTDYQSSDHNHKEDSQIAFGVDKKFTKNAKLFAFYSTIEKELDGEVIDDSSFSVGVELKF